MLIGAHVSPAGGPANAIARGVERGCDAIQIFNQNPRAWKPTVYSDEQVADFRAAMASSRVDALLIHAVYLLNAATTDKEMRDKTRASLIASLRAGDALGAHAVVLHPGSALAGKVAPAIKRAGKVIAQALAESEHCPLHLENTAGTGGHARALLPGARRPHRRRRRLQAPRACAWTPATCSPRATTSAPRRASRQVLDECVATSSGSIASAPCTSTTPRRRWAPTATATPTSARASSAAAAARSSSPSRASQDLPCVLETPGPDRHGPTKAQITLTRRLRGQGAKRRR